MNKEKSPERGPEATPPKPSSPAAPVVGKGAVVADAPAEFKKSKPALSQIELERADDEGMTRPADD